MAKRCERETSAFEQETQDVLDVTRLLQKLFGMKSNNNNMQDAKQAEKNEQPTQTSECTEPEQSQCELTQQQTEQLVRFRDAVFEDLKQVSVMNVDRLFY